MHKFLLSTNIFRIRQVNEVEDSWLAKRNSNPTMPYYKLSPMVKRTSNRVVLAILCEKKIHPIKNVWLLWLHIKSNFMYSNYIYFYDMQKFNVNGLQIIILYGKMYANNCFRRLIGKLRFHVQLYSFYIHATYLWLLFLFQSLFHDLQAHTNYVSLKSAYRINIIWRNNRNWIQAQHTK